jgi:hypothetical protein
MPHRRISSVVTHDTSYDDLIRMPSHPYLQEVTNLLEHLSIFNFRRHVRKSESEGQNTHIFGRSHCAYIKAAPPLLNQQNDSSSNMV